MVNVIVAATFLFVLNSFSLAKNIGTTIQIKGSDTMVNLAQGWAEEFMKRNPKSGVAVTGGGSGTGIAALINGTCDIAITSRQMKSKEIEMAKSKGKNPMELRVALDGIAVVVAPSNPVSKLTIDELADIFTGRVTNWKNLGGRSGQIVILSREVNSGTHIYFKEHILRRGKEKGVEEFSPSALLMPSSQAIADEVSQNPSSIGYYGMGYISKKQKVVSVATSKNKTYVKPIISTVRSGNYPISRPLLIYTNGKPEGLTKNFIDFIMSKDGQAIVKKMDFVPAK